MKPKRLSSSKLNPAKLLGGSSFSKKTSNIGEKLKEESIVISKSDLSIIKGQVFEIKNLITNLTTLKKNKLKTERAETENKKSAEREKELEKKKKPEDNKIKLPQAPKLGLLDIVKTFVVNTLIGFVAVRLIKHLPKLIEISKFIGGAMNFITDVGGKLLNGLATFVQKGYEAYDFTRKTLKSFGGDNAVKLFDGFNNALEGIITAALAASFAFANMSGGDGGGPGGGRGGYRNSYGGGKKGLDGDFRRGRFGGYVRGFGVDAEVGGGVQGHNLWKQQAKGGELTDAGLKKAQGNIMKRYFQKYGRDAFIQRFGEEGLKRLPGGMQRGLLQKGARSAFTGLLGKGGAKTVLKFVRPFLKRLPIIGAIIDFGLSVALGEDPGRALFKAIGAGLLGAIGGALGGPFALLTGLAGGWIGDQAGGALYDFFFKNKKSDSKTVKAAGGGKPITRGGKLVGGSPKRTIKKAKRQISIQPTQLKPGANIGGEEKIEKIFPKSEKNDQVSPLDYIEKSYKNTNQDKFFGSLLNLQTKSLVGQKPSKIDYVNAAQGLSNWMSITFSDEILRTSAIHAAGGGQIDSSMLSKKSGDMTDAIAKSLESSISRRLDDNINDLMQQLTLKQIESRDKDKEKAPDPEDMGEGAGVQVSSDSEDFWLLATAAMFENSNPQGAADVAQVIYNRTQYPAWNAPTIRKAILNPNQFQPVRQYGGTAAWAKIKNKEDALRFSKSHGKTQEQLERVAAALLDKSKQQSARQFVGARDSFRATAYESTNNHLADETEVQRHGHTFGFEPGGAMIGQFKAGKLSAAQVNAGIKGDVSYDDTTKLGPGSKEWRFGRTGRMNVAPGWSHAHFDGADANSLMRDMIPLLKKMASSGLKPELADGTPILSGKDNKYYQEIVKSGMAQHTHRPGPRMDVNMPGFPLVPFPLNYSFYQSGGAGHAAIVPGSGKTQLFHMSKKADGSAFHGKLIPKDGKYFLHKNEFVVDADSVKTVGKDFIASINSIENKSQLKRKVGSLIDHLSYITGYEPGGQEEIIVDVPQSEVVPMPMIIPVGGMMGMSGSGSGEDYSQELFSHA